MLYYIVVYVIFILYHIISYYIILYHIISYYIILYIGLNAQWRKLSPHIYIYNVPQSMACCFHFSNPLPQEGARFAKWRNVLQMDPAKGSLRIGTPRKGLEFPLWIDLAGGLDHFLFSHIGKNHPK